MHQLLQRILQNERSNKGKENVLYERLATGSSERHIFLHWVNGEFLQEGEIEPWHEPLRMEKRGCSHLRDKARPQRGSTMNLALRKFWKKEPEHRSQRATLTNILCRQGSRHEAGAPGQLSYNVNTHFYISKAYIYLKNRKFYELIFQIHTGGPLHIGL